MKTLFKIILSSFLFLPLTGLIGQTTTIPGMTITGNEQWKDTVILEGDVTVAPSGRLVILAGTRVLFSANMDKSHGGRDKTRAELIVKGSLIARGAINKKIRFTSTASAPRMQDWYGIQLNNPKQTAILEYTVIEYAYNGITIKKSDPQISNSQIQYNFNAGLSIELGANPTVVGNIISENGYAGVICNTGSHPILTDNMITKNEIGLIVFGTAQPNLGNLAKGRDYNVGRNGLFDNREYNLHNHSNRTILAENGSWGSKQLAEIDKTVYDAKDDSRYGQVDLQPILGSAINIQQKIILSQNNEPRQNQPKSTIANSPASTSRERIVAQPKPMLKDTSQKLIQPKTDQGSRLLAERKQKPEEIGNKKSSAAAAAIDYKQVFIDAFLDEPKMILKSVRPVIDDQSRGLRMHGKVIIKVTVDRMGNVDSAAILRGLNEYYDNLALTAAHEFKFKAGTVNGNPVIFSTSLFFEF